MSYSVDKENDDLVLAGVTQGIAPSPHLGIANIQNGNLSTETGEVFASFARVQQSQTNLGGTGTLAFSSTNQLSYSLSSFSLTAGIWITVSSSSHTGELPNQDYYIQQSASGLIKVSNFYGSAIITGFTAGLTANFVIKENFGGVAAIGGAGKAIEPYNNGTQQYRYYILDGQGLVWVYDTATANTAIGLSWFLPDASVAYFAGSAPTGIAVLNGWLMVVGGLAIYCKPTVSLGGNTNATSTWSAMYDASNNAAQLMSLETTSNPHFAFVGHQGKMYYCDGNYIGEVFPDTSINPNVTGLPNIQSFCKYGASSTTGIINAIISGSIPWNGVPSSGEIRVPAVFFAAQGGTIPNALTAGTVYYIQYINTGTFQVYAAAAGGSALNLASGANGLQYFNTFWPLVMASSQPITFTLTTQRLNLPAFEIAQTMGEIGNTIIIGCYGNILYPWNQIDPTPSSLIALPESNCPVMVNVHNMMYLFAGNKGNIYITDGSVVSHVYKIPDYCAGIPGNKQSYYEPVFTWGDAMYLRGRVYFSILDQTATKAGNCGGIWSIIPTQALYLGQDVGISLVLENQSSYGTYSGYCSFLIPNQQQNAVAPQYWSVWQASIGRTGYGIDTTGTFPTGTTIIEYDIVATGNLLGKQKRKFDNLEYKISAPLATGESIALNYRLNLTDAWQSAGTVSTDKYNLAGYISPHKIPQGQWLQIQEVFTASGNSTYSGGRMTEVRLR